METLGVTATPYMTLLALSVVLLVFHVLLQGMLSTRELGRDWNAGPRDEGVEPKGKFAGRAARASKNFQETYPAFVGLLLGVAFAGDDASGWGLIGGWIWLVSRVVYIPLYLGGVPYIRSLVWTVSLIGLLAMTIALFR
ncbi:membrane-associated protein in eicosanoid and glutathione metabolism (MAPEG) [Rhizobium sp. CF080]|uniref:MAPEG family protein n=1 Tax=Rhizobium sp. (strain CF080) TaxID=1144310 RepID=UPI000271D70D|nr:MAPEG family protein [Rhizobium sp. CF080]EUB97482.1 membrane-associated protein in eicosanoid and glutathione metabolism (MAPEG) [Rhizobium sp. CF080]